MVELLKIHFLIHPLTYAPECREDYSDERFYDAARAVEKAVLHRYREAVETLPRDEALVIYPTLYPRKDSPKPEELASLETMARRRLGRRLIVCTYPTTSADFVRRAAEQGLSYDPDTVATEAWGESFDGCVAKYASVFSKEFGLGTPVEQNFAMCVPDFAWLLTARLLDKATLPSQARFYLFETEGGSPMAAFFESYFVSGDTARSVDIPLEPSRVAAYRYDYRATFTPPRLEHISTPDVTGVRIPICNDLAEPPRRAYLVGQDVDAVRFREALLRARVTVEKRRGA